MNKTMIRFFTIFDYEEEENWLREQHKKGWKLIKMKLCFYVFEKCTLEDVIYRLDYKNNTENSSYYQMFQDYGWEYISQWFGWLYFRKPLANAEQDTEIFSDNISRLDMLRHIYMTRMLPLLIIFLCCVLPNFFIFLKPEHPYDMILTIMFSVLLLLYIGLLTYCGIKLQKLRKKYRKD